MNRCPSCPSTSETWCPGCGSHATHEYAGSLASFGRRAAAVGIDAASTVLLWLAVLWVESMGQSDFFDPPFSAEENALLLGVAAYVLVALTLFFRGQSIGKALLGLRVVGGDGETAGVGSLLLRALIGKPLSSLAFGVGYLVVLGGRTKQGWHDRIASTYVVRQDRAESRRMRRRKRSRVRRVASRRQELPQHAS